MKNYTGTAWMFILITRKSKITERVVTTYYNDYLSTHEDEMIGTAIGICIGARQYVKSVAVNVYRCTYDNGNIKERRLIRRQQ